MVNHEPPHLSRLAVISWALHDLANTIFSMNIVSLEVGFTSTQAQIVLLVSIVAAVAGGLGWGVVVDRIGPKRSLNMVLILWMAAMMLAIAIAVFDLPAILFWLVSCGAGVALGGTWASDRPYLLRLTPPNQGGSSTGYTRWWAASPA